MLHLRLLQNTDDSTLRWGAGTAQSDIASIKQLIGTKQLIDGVCLDFTGVTAVNASYIRASVAWIIRCGMAHHANPVSYHSSGGDPWSIRPAEIEGCFVANISADVREEIESVLNQPSFRLPCFEVLEWEDPVSFRLVRVLGHLDDQLRQCLSKLYALGGTGTAADLHAHYGDEGVQITAWNNRLAGLHEKLLLGRKKSGRNFIYQTFSKELEPYGLSISAA